MGTLPFSGRIKPYIRHRRHRPKDYLLGLWVLLGLVSAPMAVTLDGLPLVNQIQGTSVFNLNFGQSGTNEQIAVFLVNSNDPDGFSVTFTFSNLGRFASGGKSFAMSGLILNNLGGTLGGLLTAPVNQSFTLDGSGSWKWTPMGLGVTPTTATVNYMIELKVSWPDQSGYFAGLYRENIDAVITSGP